MKKDGLVIAVGLIFLLATITCIPVPQTANAQEGTVAIVRIFCQPSAPYKVIIEPETAYVAPGAVVAWWNKDRRREVKVQFLKGKECAVGSSAPTGFRLESQQCYTTSHMPGGGISSLKFDEEGTYEFEVEFNGIGKKEGKIVVMRRD
jgi:hypothetical protein